MKFAVFALALFLCVPASAGFFLENDAAEEPRESDNPDFGFSFGGGASATYYLDDVDFSLEVLSAYRFENPFGAFLNLSAGISEKIHAAGGGLSFFFGSGDFVSLGCSGVFFERDGKWRATPRIDVDYGHAMKPWPLAHFALQLKVRFSYLAGESLYRRKTSTSTTLSGLMALIFF